MQVAERGLQLLAGKTAAVADLTLRDAIEITRSAREDHVEPREARVEVTQKEVKSRDTEVKKHLPPVPVNMHAIYERNGREYDTSHLIDFHEDAEDAEPKPECDYESQLAGAIVELERLVRLARETLSVEQCAKMAGHIQRIALLLTDADVNGGHPESGNRI